MAQTVEEAMKDVTIDEDALADLVLELCNIASPSGQEGEAAEFVHDWLRQAGIEARKIALIPERPNVLGTIHGDSNGLSLILNSHLDTGKRPDDQLSLRNPSDPIHNSAWRKGDLFYGEGVVNNKGAMAAWMIAAKAIRDAGIQLRGDLLLSAVAGEIGTEPVDEFQAPTYMSKELGARYLIQHGGVADYALNAEGTDFATGWISPGKAFFKVTIFGEGQRYTPFASNKGPLESNQNAIVRAAAVIPALDEWGQKYEERFKYEGAGGTIVPKVVIGAIRGGNPFHVTRTSELCALYLDVRIVPGQDVLALKGELQGVVDQCGVEGKVELFVYRTPQEAAEPGALLDAINHAHAAEFGSSPAMAEGPYVSMWRDHNAFNEMGIPSITYGPGASASGENLAMRLQDLVSAARVYAAISIGICSQSRGS